MELGGKELFALGVSSMQLSDVKSIDDMKEQAGIYGVMLEQLADNLGDLQKVVAKKKDIDVYSQLLAVLSDAQHQVYKASIKLSEVEDD